MGWWYSSGPLLGRHSRRPPIYTSWLRPLAVTFAFDDRPYKLGEAIHFRVDLNAKSSVVVREAWLDLICQERWTGNFVVMAPTSLRPSVIGGGGLPASVLPIPKVPKRTFEDFKQSYIHSRAIFLQNLRLPAGATGTYNARLEIVPEPPDHVAVSTVTWKLALAIDVAQALDVHKHYPVNGPSTDLVDLAQ